jgi:hypothetical protein
MGSKRGSLGDLSRLDGAAQKIYNYQWELRWVYLPEDDGRSGLDSVGSEMFHRR